MRKILFTFLILLPGQTALAGAPVVWPLDMDTRYLTSNFMEYRSGRFHAGLDFKTDSMVGFPVRAVEDGYITRVRATPNAYGRAIYLRGRSGKTYVYAHLMRFNDTLRSEVRAEQEQNGRYRARVSFRPEEIPVRKGQVLGLSGQSGTGGPHLHFEVRNHQGRPVNPHDHGFALPDTFAPVIRSITAWPVSPQALLNGENTEVQITGPAGGGLPEKLPVLQAMGPVAFSAHIVDQSDIRGHKLEPWLIEVFLDGDLVYSCRNTECGFDENSLQRLEWVEWADWDQQKFREHWLHRRPANRLMGRQGGLWYLGAEGNGLPAGQHSIEIRARDHQGNLAQARFNLVAGPHESPKSTSWHPLEIGLRQENAFRMNPFFVQDFAANPQGEVLELFPGPHTPVLEKTNLWVVPWPAGQQLTTLGQGLQPLGAAASFLTCDWPVEGDLRVSFPDLSGLQDLDPADLKVGVYRRDRKGRWNLIGPVEKKGPGQPSVAFGLAEPGLHAVMRDTMPPSLERSRVFRIGLQDKRTIPGVTMPRWQVQPVEMVDTGSGIAAETISVWLDDKPIIVEPDLPRDRILVELPSALPPGAYQLKVQAADEAGNEARREYKLVLQISE